MSENFKAHLSIIGANLIYGVNYSIAKGIMPDYIKPFGLTVCRGIGAILLFWLFSFFSKSEKIERRDMKIIFVGALFGIAINQLLFLKGLSYTSAIDSAIIMTINPLVVILFAAFMLKERITWFKLTGIAVGGLGAIVLILHSGSASFLSENFIGNIMMVLNALSYGAYLVIIQPMMKKYRPITVMKWTFVFGFIFIFPIGFNEFIQIDWNAIPVSILFSVGFVVIGSTFLAYLLNVYGLKHVSPSVVSIYIYSQPAIASLVAYFTLNESLTFTKLISMALIFTGVYMVSRRKEINTVDFIAVPKFVMCKIRSFIKKC